MPTILFPSFPSVTRTNSFLRLTLTSDSDSIISETIYQEYNSLIEKGFFSHQTSEGTIYALSIYLDAKASE